MDEFIRNSGMYRKMLDIHTDDEIIDTIKHKIAETIPLDEFEQIYTLNNITNIENVINIYELMDFSNMINMCKYLLNKHASNLILLPPRDCIQEYLDKHYVNQQIAINLCNTKYITSYVKINDENDELYSCSEMLRNITHLRTLIHTRWIIPIIAKHNTLIHLEVHNYTVELGYLKNLMSLHSLKYSNLHESTSTYFINTINSLNIDKLELMYDERLPLCDTTINVNTLIINSISSRDYGETLTFHISDVDNLIYNIVDNYIDYIMINDLNVYINLSENITKKINIHCHKNCVIRSNKINLLNICHDL